jgi:hypothetical protein
MKKVICFSVLAAVAALAVTKFGPDFRRELKIYSM